MKPILFQDNETTFTSNGLGRIDAIKCEVTEARNGQFELEMDVSIDERHFQEIKEGRILLARHDDTVDTQPFEIYQISKPLNGRVTVYAHHISYRTEKITVTPFNAQQGIAAAMTAIQSHCVGTNPFVLWTDKTTTGKFTMEKPATLRSLLGGTAGSLLDVYGTGEYEWDRFTIKLHASRGCDTGVVLRYGKNITELKKTSDVSSVWTGIVPFWFGVSEESPGEDELVMLPEVVLYSSAAADYAYAMIVPLDLSGNFEGKPTEAQLRTAAQNYVDNNEITDIPTSIEVSFIAAWQTDEYKNVAPLERLSLCDTITIRHTRLGVDSKAKIIKTVFDVLKEKYISMTVGEARTNLATEISGGLQASVDDIRRTMATKQRVTSVVNAKIEEATTKITGGDGGHIVFQKDANDNPREILAMNTDDVATATNVLRINMNGIGFSSTGINGPYRSAWTLDGQFVADFITAGTMSANHVRAGIITDNSGLNYWNLDTGELQMTNGSIDIGDFEVDSTGKLTCTGADISGELHTKDTAGTYYIDIEDGEIRAGKIVNGTKTESGAVSFLDIEQYPGSGYMIPGVLVHGQSATFETYNGPLYINSSEYMGLYSVDDMEVKSDDDININCQYRLTLTGLSQVKAAGNTVILESENITLEASYGRTLIRGPIYVDEEQSGYQGITGSYWSWIWGSAWNLNQPLLLNFRNGICVDAHY